jgi:hypothetical protein
MGMAYRAYGMFWPMVILLFSSLIAEEERIWLQEKLGFMGEITGLGLATWAAGRINTVQPSLPWGRWKIEIGADDGLRRSTFC